MTTDRELPLRLCLYGDGRHLLDCFELVRQAGAGGPGGAFDGMELDAAAADGDTTGLTDIVVTATKRATNLQETPIAIAGPEGIRARFTLEELLPASFGPANLPR